MAIFNGLAKEIAKKIDLKALAKRIDMREELKNKVTQITAAATDEQYPSAKAVYDAIKSAKDSAKADALALESKKAGYEFGDVYPDIRTIVFNESSGGYAISAGKEILANSSLWRLTEIENRIMCVFNEDIGIGAELVEAIEDVSGVYYRLYYLAKCTDIEFDSNGVKISYTFTFYEGTVLQTQGVLQAITLLTESSTPIDIFKPTVDINENSKDGEFPTSKAVYNFVTKHDLTVGRFANYENTDLRYSGSGWKVYIRQTASDRVCLRLENAHITSSPASRILYLYLMGDQRYVFQINNDAKKGYMDYRVEGSSTALSAGATDWWFDYDNGYIELLIDTSAVAGIAQTREFTIVSAIVMDYSWNNLAEVKRVYFHLEELLTDTALRTVFGAIASATTVKQIATAAQAFINKFGGA